MLLFDTFFYVFRDRRGLFFKILRNPYLECSKCARFKCRSNLIFRRSRTARDNSSSEAYRFFGEKKRLFLPKILEKSRDALGNGILLKSSPAL